MKRHIHKTLWLTLLATSCKTPRHATAIHQADTKLIIRHLHENTLSTTSSDTSKRNDTVYITTLKTTHHYTTTSDTVTILHSDTVTNITTSAPCKKHSDTTPLATIAATTIATILIIWTIRKTWKISGTPQK
ncbi:MAG: hypothetical protein IKY43_06335 [Bacteroidales bacterium]|nr:hypothetical protein [Bacteroidales bacterium]